ncbi:MAG: carboxypeptidase regulatory-like domain-containing protein, partial [Gammaproteobacteria bacterium]|nr:carboxypeptidase regulatory-like domain-containing protein [Gammaproteobacteria bacterium]
LNPATAPIRITEPPPNFFRQQWANVRNSKVVGPLFKSLGHALSGTHVGGEFSKHLSGEMDRATAVDDDIDVTYALARTWDTAIAEPASMVAELAGKGIEKGAIAIGKGMEQFADRAREVGVIRALGEGTTLAIVKGFQGAGWALGTGAAHALGGAEYVFNNPLEAANGASLAAGEFLGVKAISDLAVRENEILIGNTIELRRQLNAHVEALAKRADKLHALIARTRQAVREQDPESAGFQRDIGNAFARYAQEHKSLIDDYIRWRLFLNRNFGGIENPTIADAWRELRERVERITSLPPDLATIFDAAFINSLKSTVRLHLFDATSGEPVSKGGVVQFSGTQTLNCRAQGPIMACNGVPPGKLNMTIKVGDYATVNRDVVIQPLARRHYDQRVNLTADGPIWARISVTVRDVDTGNAIPGALIRFTSNAEATRETTTTTGAVQVNQVLTGDVQITASAAGYLANRSSLHIEPSQNTGYALEIQLQPDGSAKAEPKPLAVPASFDCSQLRLAHNINFSTWSCCKDKVEREMSDSMCRAKRGEMNGKTLAFKSRIADAIRAAEGERFDRNGDYTDYQTPYGTLREVQTCVDTQVDDFCRRLGSGAATREEQEDDRAASRKSAVETCYARKQELITNALKSNSDGDSGFVLIHATEACKTAHKQCEDRAYAFGKACRAKATTMDEVRAYQEVQCSAAFYRQQCEEQVK